MTGRPRHPDKSLEDLLREAEDHGWRFERRRQYFRGFCGCGQHMKTIHMTPSDANYLRNIKKWFERMCW